MYHRQEDRKPSGKDLAFVIIIPGLLIAWMIYFYYTADDRAPVVLKRATVHFLGTDFQVIESSQ